MSAPSVCEKASKCLSKRCIQNIFLTFTRSKNSRFLGYYMRKLPGPDLQRRKEKYRATVLKPYEDMLPLSSRLKEINAKDPLLYPKVDIGLPSTLYKEKITLKDRLEWRKRIALRKSQSPLEDVRLDLNTIRKDWQRNDGPLHLLKVANHYGIFSHLYDHGYFIPCVPLNISYNYDAETNSPVCMGNILHADDVKTTPNVSFKSNPDDLWTLVLTNLDGHLLDTDSEYLQWFVGNIKSSSIESGETICDYLRPFPMRGTGYHRLVFVLYKQDKVIDFTSIKRELPCFNLKERTFKSLDFYKNFQDHLTPAGLAFYQCTWDETLTDFFHNVLNMREPVFEYVNPKLDIKPQVQFPHLEPFNLYLDRYRDPKEMKKEVLLKRLKAIHPFEEEPPMPKYPCLHKPDDYEFSWQKESMRRERLRLGRYRDLRPHSVYPQEDDQFKDWHKR